MKGRRVHVFFLVTLWVKAVFAAGEILAGVATLVISQRFLLHELVAAYAETSNDRVASFFLHTAQHLTIGAKTFAAVYLLAHGVIKLWLVVGLLRRRLWYYPVALVVFAGFIAYQLYRYALHRSVLLLVITALDVIVVALTWHEWRYLRSEA